MQRNLAWDWTIGVVVTFQNSTPHVKPSSEPTLWNYPCLPTYTLFCKPPHHRHAVGGTLCNHTVVVPYWEWVTVVSSGCTPIPQGVFWLLMSWVFCNSLIYVYGITSVSSTIPISPLWFPSIPRSASIPTMVTETSPPTCMLIKWESTRCCSKRDRGLHHWR